MGVNLEMYRARIGLFNRHRYKVHVVSSVFNSILVTSIVLSVMTLVMYLILLCGDVELNPGPQSTCLSLWHCNIRGLNTEKLLALKSEIEGHFDLVAVTETLLCNTKTLDLSLNGYLPIFRKDRGQGDVPWGGVALYVNENIIAKRKTEFEINSLEILCIELVTKRKKTVICVCYRPPNSGIIFWDQLQHVYDSIRRAGYINIISTGDFNADPNTASGTKLHFVVNSNSLLMLIDQPTRYTINTATILDQFIVTPTLRAGNVSITPPLATTDHCQISCNISIDLPPKTTLSRHIWLYSEADWEGLNAAIINHDWQAHLDRQNVNEITFLITQSFINLARQFIPNKIVTIRKGDQPWYTNLLRSKRRQRDRLFRHAKLKNTNEAWSKYRRIRNEYVHCLALSKEAYENKQISKLELEDIGGRGWWQTIKQHIGNSKSDNMPALLLPSGEAVHDNISKASALNNFFVSHSTVDDSHTTLPAAKFITEGRLTSIRLSEKEVQDILVTLKPAKAPGPDGISPHVLKLTAKTISKPLTNLFNVSLQHGIFPDTWKQANVIPIFKKGDKSSPNNYRPVSLLSSVGKVMEKCIFKHMYNYFRDNDLIYKFQSGFLPGCSTTHHLVHLYHSISEAFDKGSKVQMVFGDISKAFDKVWHAGLLFKLKNMGVTEELLAWIRNYLCDRKQRVVLQGESCCWADINAGVPQGSVLGPLLLLVYINDMVEGLALKLTLFADDNLLLSISNCHMINSKILNSDLEKLEAWAQQWIVSFSALKTNSMVVN